jgi:hypothetical protein
VSRSSCTVASKRHRTTKGAAQQGQYCSARKVSAFCFWAKLNSRERALVEGQLRDRRLHRSIQETECSPGCQSRAAGVANFDRANPSQRSPDLSASQVTASRYVGRHFWSWSCRGVLKVPESRKPSLCPKTHIHTLTDARFQRYCYGLFRCRSLTARSLASWLALAFLCSVVLHL